MQSFELTKPVSSASLLKQFESRFGQTMNLDGLDQTQLEDLANGVRTKIHTITDNLHFGKELTDNEYQKHQMMFNIDTWNISFNYFSTEIVFNICCSKSSVCTT